VASPIPIKNIYFLLAYAWDRLPEAGLVDISGLDTEEVVDLLAFVLLHGVHHLMRRGLDQDYQTIAEEIAGIRGRIDIGTTARRMLAPHGRAACEFDQLVVDTLPNRILKAGVRELIRHSELDSRLRIRLRGVYRELSEISDVPLRRDVFRSVQLHSNNRFYRFLLSICELILEMTLVRESPGSARFRDFLRDERAMARLFEAFVFNFYSKERPGLQIKKERINWHASSQADPELRYLPAMETDLSVRDKPHTKTLILDTKFYSETLQTNYDRRSVHSANLYQLVAYLGSLRFRTGPDSRASGMLLYPVVDRAVRLDYELNGFAVQVRTVDLSAHASAIRTSLLSIIDEVFEGSGAPRGPLSRAAI
jgi:5-methylcytosine-specific restriction enzyme subunit McrC